MKNLLLFLVFLVHLSMRAQAEYVCAEEATFSYNPLCEDCCEKTFMLRGSIFLFPNPNFGVFELKGLEEGEKTGNVYDLVGRLIVEKINILNEITLPDIADGTYILKINESGRIAKFVKQ